MKSIASIALASLFCLCLTVYGDGSLSDNIRISSKTLGYELQYRVYLPESVTDLDNLPTIYITDGPGYLSQGKMKQVLDNEISAGRLEPLIAIFVDSRDPNKLSVNRRNQQFMCNKDYALFYINELVPTIDANYSVSSSREKRVIAGVSFGALNAACFGLMASNTFAGIGMHSPANSKHLKLLSKLYREQDKLPLKMFMSVGLKRDNTRAGRKFHTVLVNKGYSVNYIEVPFGHEWANWRPLIDDLLLTFFKN